MSPDMPTLFDLEADDGGGEQKPDVRPRSGRARRPAGRPAGRLLLDRCPRCGMDTLDPGNNESRKWRLRRAWTDDLNLPPPKPVGVCEDCDAKLSARIDHLIDHHEGNVVVYGEPLADYITSLSWESEDDQARALMHDGALSRNPRTAGEGGWWRFAAYRDAMRLDVPVEILFADDWADRDEWDGEYPTALYMRRNVVDVYSTLLNNEKPEPPPAPRPQHAPRQDPQGEPMKIIVLVTTERRPDLVAGEIKTNLDKIDGIKTATADATVGAFDVHVTVHADDDHVAYEAVMQVADTPGVTRAVHLILTNSGSSDGE